MPHKAWTDEDLKREVPRVVTYRELCGVLNLTGSGYTSKMIKLRIRALNLSIEHFDITKKKERIQRESICGYRKCSLCKTEKEIKFFGFRNTEKRIRSYRCDECQRGLSSAHYKRHRSKYKKRVALRSKESTLVQQGKMYDYLIKHPCSHCQERDPVVLEFHHIEKKEYDVGAMVGTVSWEKIEQEMAKCIVLCSNCHRRETMRLRNSFRYRRSLEMGFVHGLCSRLYSTAT